MEDRLLDAKELAGKLGVKPCTVLIWANQGKIPALRLTPKTLRFELEEVLDALRAHPQSHKAAVTTEGEQ